MIDLPSVILCIFSQDDRRNAHAPYMQMKHFKLFLLIPLALWLASCGVFHVEVQVINEAADQGTGTSTITPPITPATISAGAPTFTPATTITRPQSEHSPAITPILTRIPPTTSTTSIMSQEHRRALGDYFSSSFSYDAALGDLDGDGDLDTFVANRFAPEGIWFNDGMGHFTESDQVIGWDTYTLAAALGDLDNDGDLDVYLGNSVNTHDEIWFNDGDGHFTDTGQRPSNRYTEDVALGDLDQDGDLDAVIATLDEANNKGTVKIWLNDGKGQFTDSGPQLGDLPCQAVALGDLDGDKDLDIFAAYTSFDKTVESTQLVWLNDGKGRFTKTPQSFAIERLRTVTLGDVDNDGDLDLLQGNEGDWNRIWLNDGMANFTDSGQELGIGWTSAATLADINQDGNLDALIGSEREGTRLWLNNGLGQFYLTKRDLYGNHTNAIVVGNLDWDEAPDILIANSGDEDSEWGYYCEIWFNLYGVIPYP